MATLFRYHIGDSVRLPRKRIVLLVASLSIALAAFTALTASALHIKPFLLDKQNNDSVLDNPTYQTTQAPNTPTDSMTTESVFMQNQNSSDEQVSNTTQVTVNGEVIPVPENGEVHKEFADPDSKTTIDISVDNNTTGTTNNTRNRSSVRLYTNSRSTSNISDRQVTKSSLEVNP